jgi:signal transduction histidine kinase/ligand-binding sensor domain-containing protein/CheY-like chemotaxis protein
MWFGTNDGLNRFDSRNIRIYKHDPNDSTSLWDNRIITLLVDSRDRLWIGTAKGLNLYDPQCDCFDRFLPEDYRQAASEFYIRSMTEDPSAGIWVGTSFGLFLFDPESERFVVHDPNARPSTMFVGKNIVKIRPGSSGSYWLCARDGLYTWDGKTLGDPSKEYTHFGMLSGQEIRDIVRDDRGHYWVATESLQHGIYHFDGEMRLVEELVNSSSTTPKLAGNRVRVLQQLADRNVWIGTFEGLSIMDPGTGSVKHYQPNKFDPKSLQGRSVRAIFEDQDGGVWVGTYNGGVNYYHPSFTMFHHEQAQVWTENSLSDNLVSSFAEQGKHTLWIGTEHGLNHLDRVSGRYTHYYRGGDHNGLLDNTIKSLEFDDKGHLWIGSLQGLSKLDLDKGAFKHYVHDSRDSTSLGRGHIHVVYKDAHQRLWIGTNGGGLNLYDPIGDRFDRYMHIAGVPRTRVTHINALTEGSDGLLWVGTSNGVQCFDATKMVFVSPAVFQSDIFRLLTAAPVHALYFDDSQNLWIGSHGLGLVIFDLGTGDYAHLTTDSGLPDNTVKGIMLDDLGHAWISSNRGLSRLKRPREGWMAVARNNITNFNTTDGLQGYQFYANAVLRTIDGKLYFGGTNGFNTFDPRAVEKTVVVSEVIFTDLSVRDELKSKMQVHARTKESGEDAPIVLKSNQSDFSLEFAALNYFDPENTVYAYMLEPVRQDWQVLGTTPVVNFSQLAPGDYTFRVRASNNPDVWGQDYSQLSIRIMPPFWRTGLAFLLYLAILSALLFVFFQVATRWGKLKSDLVYEHHEREKEQELHQQRIRFFTNISHELRTPLTLILAPLERLVKQDIGNNRLRNQLIMIQRNGERMLQLINQLLDLRKMETGHMRLRAAEGDIVRFIREIAIAFRETAEYKGIQFVTHLPNGPLQYWYDRDKMEIILYNLLSNAVKNTQKGGHIGIYVREVHQEGGFNTDAGQNGSHVFMDGHLEIVVEDNGRGIPGENLQHIFNRFYQAKTNDYTRTYGSGVGLEIVKRFMDLHKGQIDVESYESKEGQPGKTRFILKLPAGKRHLGSEDIMQDFRSSEDIDLYRHTLRQTVEGEVEADRSGSENIHGTQALVPHEDATLLIVEDNDEVRTFIVRVFRDHYRILEASNGAQGLALAQEYIPDLILSDVMMPGMDGMELCRKVKTDDRTSHIPVILLSARTAVTHRIEGMETGADDYVTKPFSAQELDARVKNLIEQRKKLRAKFSRQLMVPEEVTITSVDEKLLKRTIDYIQEHMSDPDLNVEKVAAEVGMSRVHFYRKIRALTDLSPVAFIRRIRLEKAAQLLQTGKLNVSEVRYAIGIQDPNYFRKVFKQHFGTSPSDYGDRDTANKEDRKSEV